MGQRAAQWCPRSGGRATRLSRAGASTMLRRRAGVAEWQTRQTQNLLSERTWEFKSPRPHQVLPALDPGKKQRVQGCEAAHGIGRGANFVATASERTDSLRDRVAVVVDDVGEFRDRRRFAVRGSSFIN